MLKMMTYQEANAILGSSLSPYNYCICKKTALDNGANESSINSIIGSDAAYNRLVPPEAIGGSSSGTTYTIIFAKDRTYETGIYFYMNDGSVVPVSQSNQISANDVQGVAYLAEVNGENSGSFLIDTVESTDISFGKLGSSENVQGAYGIDGTNRLKANEDSQNPMPILNWLRSRFNNQGYIPGTYEFQIMSKYVDDINTAMNFIGGTPMAKCIDIDSSSRTVDYDEYANSSNHWYNGNIWYWVASCRYENLYDLNSIYGVSCVPGKVPDVYGDPTTIYYNQDYYNYATNTNLQHRVRVIKPLNIECPQTAPQNSIIQTVTVNSGEYPVCTEIVNNYAPTGYAFYAWDPSLHPAYRDEIYKALWERVSPSVYYTITWKDSLDANWSETTQVGEGMWPSHSAPIHSGYTFTGWSPTVVPAEGDAEYTAQYRQSTPADEEPAEYTIYCEGVPSGGTVYVDVTQTQVGITWTGPEPIDQGWYVSGSGTSPQANSAGRANRWGSGYVNGLDFSQTGTIQSGGYVTYNVYAIHPASGGTTSIAGQWDVQVVNVHGT